MRNQNIDRGWQFNYGTIDGFPDPSRESTLREVDLPHDYMIFSSVKKDAPAGASSGFFTEGVAYYTKKVMIPTELENDDVCLKFDGDAKWLFSTTDTLLFL